MRIGANSARGRRPIRPRAAGEPGGALVRGRVEEVRLLQQPRVPDFRSRSVDNVPTMIPPERMLRRRPYPAPIGVTEAGTRSAARSSPPSEWAALLVERNRRPGRSTLTADPVEEDQDRVRDTQVARSPRSGPGMIECPSAAAKTSVQTLAEKGRGDVRTYPQHFEVAVLRCAVERTGRGWETRFGNCRRRESACLSATVRVRRRCRRHPHGRALLRDRPRIADGMQRPKRLKMATTRDSRWPRLRCSASVAAATTDDRRASQALSSPLRDDPADAKRPSSHKLLVRGGLIARSARDLVVQLPARLRAAPQGRQIVREGWTRIGSQEMLATC